MTDINQLKKLRELTGRSVKDVKKALDDAGGDFDAALGNLDASAKKRLDKLSSNTIENGRVHTYTHHDGKTAVMVEVGCQTDFAAKSPKFLEFCDDLCLHIVATECESNVEDEKFVKDSSKTVKDVVAELAAVLGENVRIGRYVFWKL